MGKSKLGSNPLIPSKGLGALLPEAREPEDKHPNASADRNIISSTLHIEHTGKQSDKSVSHLVNTVTAPSTEDAELQRHTFYLTRPQAQKIKLYALLHGMQISEVIRMLIDRHLKIKP